MSSGSHVLLVVAMFKKSITGVMTFSFLCTVRQFSPFTKGFGFFSIFPFFLGIKAVIEKWKVLKKPHSLMYAAVVVFVSLHL
jgi:hypothetical protein